MEKKNYGLSFALMAYSFALLVLATIVICNGNICLCTRLIVSILAIIISVVFAILSKSTYQKIVVTRKEDELNDQIETLKKDKANLEKRLKESTADKTEEINRLKMLREHEERMAIIKALGANCDKENADTIQAKLEEIVKKIDSFKQP